MGIRTTTRRAAAVVSLLVAAAGCGTVVEDSHVDSTEAKPAVIQSQFVRAANAVCHDTTARIAQALEERGSLAAVLADVAEWHNVGVRELEAISPPAGTATRYRAFLALLVQRERMVARTAREDLDRLPSALRTTRRMTRQATVMADRIGLETCPYR